MNKLGRIMLAGGAVGAATFGYAAGVERSHWTLRRAEVPVLAEGAPELRVLHISDLHMLPNQRAKQRWVAALDELAPDLVVNTGDNLAHPQAVPAALRALGSLLDRPGLFVFGSNDYYGPKPKNPARYLLPSAKTKRIHGDPLPWRDLRAAMTERGWLDVTHRWSDLEINGVRIHVAGLDDPHLKRDKYSKIAGAPAHDAHLRLGLTHSPEPRVLDAFADDDSTSCWPGTPTVGSCGCRATARWSPTASWTARGRAAHRRGASGCTCTSRPGWAPRRTRRCASPARRRRRC